MIQITCPVCSNEIPLDRIVGSSAYCSCGHVLTVLRRQSDRDARRTSVSLIVFTLFMAGAIIHAINWDTYFLSIIPLKIKQFTGMAKSTELKEIALICNSRKKNNCEIQALEKSFELDKKDITSLLRVGELYIESGDFHSAAKTYTVYFKNGGSEDSARYAYARSLGEIGLFHDAKKQFHYILKRDRNKPQFKVARSYVEFLIKNKDYSTARSIIEEYRRAGPSSALFLEKEWKTINDRLSKQNDKRSSSTRGA